MQHGTAEERGAVGAQKVNPEDLYKIANQQFWYGTSSPNMIEIMKVRCELFQATWNEFYKLGGHWSKWQFWKEHLHKHCKDFMVEDLDPEEKVLDSKVRKGQKLYGDDLGIPTLDNLFVLETDPVAATSGEGKGETSGEGSESSGGEGKALAGEEDMEMAEAAGAVDDSNT